MNSLISTSEKKRPPMGRGLYDLLIGRLGGRAEWEGRLHVGTDRQEIEWQYDVPEGLEQVEEWLGSREEPGKLTELGLAVLEGSSKELVDIYYDTEDWRLYQAGYALRIRRESSGGDPEATMKSLISESSAAGNLRKWREISELLKSDRGDALLTARGPVGVRLRALLGSHNVRQIFEVRTRRQTFDLIPNRQITNPEKALAAGRVGEVALDRSEIPLGPAIEPTRLARVEVEVDASAMIASPELKGFVKEMERALRLRPATISKYEVGLFATGQSPSNIANLKAGASKKE